MHAGHLAKVVDRASIARLDRAINVQAGPVRTPDQA